MVLERLVDCGPVAVIYADGIAGVIVNDPNVRIMFFEYREIDGERVRVPVVEIIRPIVSCEAGALLRLIAQKRARGEGAVVALH